MGQDKSYFPVVFPAPEFVSKLIYKAVKLIYSQLTAIIEDSENIFQTLELGNDDNTRRACCRPCFRD
jgi:hypothetical protein